MSLTLSPNLKGTLQFSQVRFSTKVPEGYRGDLHYKLVPQGPRTTHGVDTRKNRLDVILKKSAFNAFKEAEAPSAHLMNLEGGLVLVIYLFNRHKLDKHSQFGLFDFFYIWWKIVILGTICIMIFLVFGWLIIPLCASSTPSICCLYFSLLYFAENGTLDEPKAT